MAIGTLLAVPLLGVLASVYASQNTKAACKEAKKEYADKKNTVGTGNETSPPTTPASGIPKTENSVEINHDKLYNIAYQHYRISLDAFLKDAFPGMSRWEPRSTNFLNDEFHIITVIYEDGYRQECMVEPMQSKGCIRFSFMEKPEPHPKVPEPEKGPEQEPEQKPETPKKNEDEKPVEKVSWLAQNMDWLKEQEKICRQNEEDFFIIDKEHLFSDDDDIIGLSEQLSYYGMLLGSEDGIYTVSICN